MRSRSLVLFVLLIAAACGDESNVSVPNKSDLADAGSPDANIDAATSGVDAFAPDAWVLDAGDASRPPDADAAQPPYVPAYYDINHILSTGQSLSIASRGNPPLTLTQPFDNLTFNTGVMSDGTNLTSFIPLVEGDLHPTYGPVETMSSSLANLVTGLARAKLAGQPAGKRTHDLLVSVHGLGGTAYAGLKKGTTPYANGMAQATAGKILAMAAGKTYVVRAVTNVHGESDHVAGNLNYESNLVEWQEDYDADVRAITGQALPIPMFINQMSSFTKYGQTSSRITSDQLAAHEDHPGAIILVGPKYHLAYSSDGVHLTNEGYRQMGEDMAKAYRVVVLEGKPWEPVRPKSIVRQGAKVVVSYHVPAPPLVLDTTLVSNPGNDGFAYSDASQTPPSIISVAVTGPSEVTITLSGPAMAGGHLTYAMSGVAGAGGGPTTGARGNLRDSDTTPSRAGYKLYNWGVHFDKVIP